MRNIKKAVEWAVGIANDDSHGYDQLRRYGPDYDCSSLVAAALRYGGFQVSQFSWTGNLKQQLEAEGFKTCKAPFKAGDIHLTPGRHVAMSVNDREIVHARINELGKTTGGQTGDQTGNEIAVTNYYEPAYGWTYHYRWAEFVSIWDVALNVLRGVYGNIPERKIMLESEGFDYDYVQAHVNAIILTRRWLRAGFEFGPDMKRACQEQGINWDYVMEYYNLLSNEVVSDG